MDFEHDPDLRPNIMQACKRPGTKCPCSPFVLSCEALLKAGAPRYMLAACFYFYLSMEDQSPGMLLGGVCVGFLMLVSHPLAMAFMACRLSDSLCAGE